MKILVWCPNFNFGGGSRLFVNFVNALICNPKIKEVELIIPEYLFMHIENKINQEIKIYIIKQYSENIIKFFDKPGKIFSIPGTGFLKRLISEFLKKYLEILERRKICKIIKKSKGDIIYCFWPHFKNFIKTDKPVVCTIQDTIMFEFPEIPGAYNINLERKRLLEWLNSSTRVIVSSESTKKNIYEYFGIFNNIYVVRHDAFPDNFENINNQSDYSLPDKYIIYPGNITTHKNHYNLLIAWSKLLKKYNIPLVLIGEGTEIIGFDGDEYPLYYSWQELRLIGLIKRLGLKKNKHFYALGFIEDNLVLPLIKKAYALIMPSLSEGGGSYPVEEALTVGTPVLCSDIPVMREHLKYRSAKIGWFDPLSIDSIVNSV
ncbi:MAG: glycosyltransferase family 4 protein [Spirochaetes bacterium]|nr:glycosyltransferase family 4 protein [Spirochaetota bacterium]